MYNPAKYTIPAREGQSMREKADSDTCVLYYGKCLDSDTDSFDSFAANIEVSTRPRSAPPVRSALPFAHTITGETRAAASTAPVVGK